MKVIFLDHDGVICLQNNWGSRYKKRKKSPFKIEGDQKLPVDLRFDNFDKKSVKVLNRILEKTGAEIVVSSDWKLHASLEELGQYYEAQGIDKKPIGLTPRLEDIDEYSSSLYAWKGWLEKARTLEIKNYLETNSEIENWVAVDDLDMGVDYLGKDGLENFVICRRSLEGIKQLGVEDTIIECLNS